MSSMPDSHTPPLSPPTMSTQTQCLLLRAGPCEPAAGEEHDHAWRVLGQLHAARLQAAGRGHAGGAGLAGAGAAAAAGVSQVRTSAGVLSVACR